MSKKPIHSLLFVPAKEKMLAKISSSQADAWIVDLEDSISSDEKSAALEAAVQYLGQSPCAGDCFVRLDRKLLSEQVLALSEMPIRGFMIPKVENCEFISECPSAFANRENIALIETPRGMVEIENIVNCDLFFALAFGAEDYTAAANMQNSETSLLYAKSRMVMYARAYGKHAYDTPSFCIANIAKADDEAIHSASLGFCGKMAIHPKLIPGINKAFGEHDIGKMREIVSLFERQGGGVLVSDGKVFEAMHIARFKRIIRESQNSQQ